MAEENYLLLWTDLRNTVLSHNGKIATTAVNENLCIQHLPAWINNYSPWIVLSSYEALQFVAKHLSLVSQIKTWSYSHCCCKGVWTLLLPFMVKNQSDKGINKEPILIDNYINITFKDVQASSKLKESVTESEHLTPVIPTTYRLLPGSIFYFSRQICARQICNFLKSAYKSLSIPQSSGQAMVCLHSAVQTTFQRPVPHSIFYWFTLYISVLDCYF